MKAKGKGVYKAKKAHTLFKLEGKGSLELLGYGGWGRVVSLLVGIWALFWRPPLGMFTLQVRLGTLWPADPIFGQFPLSLHMAAPVDFPKNLKKWPNHWKAQRELGELRKGENVFGIRGRKRPIKIAATPADFPESYFFAFFSYLSAL